MPRSLDVDARDRKVVEAAWAVIVRDGLPALTVRNVAAHAGLAPSSLRYTFPSQAAVRERAIGAVLERLQQRVESLPVSLNGRAWARAALLELLPLDDQRRLEMQVGLALGVAAMVDSTLQPLHRAVNDVVGSVCLRAAAQLEAGTLVSAHALHAMVDGLALQLVTAGPSQTEWAVEVVDHLLDAAAAAAATCAGPVARAPTSA